jgi:membrane protease YdiL (CAAX protease family)
MKSFIRNLTWPAEFVIVLLICFGLGIGFQIWSITNRYPIVLNDRRLISGLVLDFVFLALVFWIGRIRGWSFTSFGCRISWKGTAAGILLFVAVSFAQIVTDILAHFIHPDNPGFVEIDLSVPVIILISLTNPIFEELLESGYIICSLQRYGMWPAILASGVFRALLHSYQGFSGVLCMLVMGLAYGFVYWRWRQLWPLIVAHALNDFLGLLYNRH